VFCTHCGGPVPSGATFCPTCGYRTDAIVPAAAAAPAPGPFYAGFWRRVAAYLIDSIIISFPFVFFIILFAAAGGFLSRGAPDLAGAPSPAIVLLQMGIMLLALLSFLVGWLYEAFFVSSKSQATPGKMALGIIVTDLAGNRLSFGRASGRFFAKILSSMTFNIGYLMAGFTQKKQALHDMVAGTLVVKR